MRLPTSQRLRDAAGGVALGGLVGVLTPVWGAHRAVSLVRTARSDGRTEPIERTTLDEIPLADLMRRNRPAIVTDLVDRIDFRTRPDVEGFRSLAASHPDRFTVKRHARHAPYFLYVGDYGAELERVERLTLDEFLDLMFVDPPDDTCTYRLFATDDLDGAAGEMIDDIAAAVSRLVDRRTERRASGVWVGSEGVVTPLHHDAWTGLLVQTAGSKRVAMYSPTDRVNLSFVSPFAPTERWSTLPARSAEADPHTHPRFAKAVRHEARLDAGEALFIPPFWSHEVEALEANISIPFRFATRPLDHLNPGFLRPAYEILHRRMTSHRV